MSKQRSGTRLRDAAGARVRRKATPEDTIRLKGFASIVCYDPEGQVKWRQEKTGNLVVTEGRNHIGDVQFASVTQVTDWYVGLTGSAPTPAATDTLGTHTGWSEFVDYDVTLRQAWTEARVSNGSWTNTSNVATFTISTNSSTIGGCFLTETATNTTTTGILYAVVAFSSDKTADQNDTLEVTYVQTTADDGV